MQVFDDRFQAESGWNLISILTGWLFKKKSLSFVRKKKRRLLLFKKKAVQLAPLNLTTLVIIRDAFYIEKYQFAVLGFLNRY
jgi:hypothetical protein